MGATLDRVARFWPKFPISSDSGAWRAIAMRTLREGLGPKLLFGRRLAQVILSERQPFDTSPPAEVPRRVDFRGPPPWLAREAHFRRL
jgi:hypothetical protein